MNALEKTCKRCGRALSAHKSVERGIGPICVTKQGDLVEDENQVQLFGDSFIYNYKGFGNCKSQCQIDVVREHGKTIVIFTDIGVGTSVTNFSEQLATQMVYRLGLNPKETLWAERYRQGGKDESVDQIEYEWDGKEYRNPHWRPLSGSYKILLTA